MPTTLKVAWNFKSAFALHAACGGYLAIVDALQQSIPQANFEAALPQIEEQFSLGWSVVTAAEQRKLREVEQRDREIAEKVAAATLEQMDYKFQQDLEKLRSRLPSKDQEAKEAALDSKPCEFGRAILQRLLEGGHAALPALKFIGCLRQDQVDVQLALESKVYEHWDASSLAPPKARTREQFPDPSLNFLCWSGEAPSFPESALTKFAEGTEAHNAVKAMKKTLLEEFPNSTVTPTARNQQQVVKAYCVGTRQKPAVVVDKDFKLWIGNEGEEEMELSGCELCGFNLGTFEEKAVTGSTSDWGCCCTDQGCEAKAVFDSHIEDACKVVGETLLIRSNNECERGTAPVAPKSKAKPEPKDTSQKQRPSTAKAKAKGVAKAKAKPEPKSGGKSGSAAKAKAKAKSEPKKELKRPATSLKRPAAVVEDAEAAEDADTKEPAAEGPASASGRDTLLS
eukprot:symbB.v1.2.005545.t1/scaffold308.1/size235111/8